MQSVGPSLGGISSPSCLDSLSLSVRLCLCMFGKDRRERTMTRSEEAVKLNGIINGTKDSNGITLFNKQRAPFGPVSLWDFMHL